MKRLVLLITLFIIANSNKTFAQNQWNLNAYHDYTTYIDLNCSLNGESNGTEYFAFYADNRSESKISFTVNYTITDNCGKSHSGSWSTSIIQAGQRGSILESVYTGCPIQKGKGHLVKNITCTVSNFKDLSKNESNLNANKITEQQKEKEETKNSSPTSTSYYNSSTTTNSKPKQPTWQERDAQIKAENQRIYQQNQQRIAETQQKSKEEGEKFVNDAVELGGMIGNMMESNRKDREKKEAKKLALKKENDEYYAKLDQQNKENIKAVNQTINKYLVEARKGNEDAVQKVIEAYDKKATYYGPSPFNEKFEFILEMYNNNKSPISKIFLKNYYTKEVERYKEENKYHISRSIQNLAWSGAFYSIRLFVPKQYDANGEVDSGAEFPRWGFGYVVAGYFAVTGIVHLFRIGYKNKPEYLQAKSRIEQLNINKSKLSFSPNFDLQRNNFGLAMQLKF
jgi:hypothetical protein